MDEDRKPEDAGAYIGREPELAEETIPGGLQPGDERVAAHATQSGGEGAGAGTAGEDEWPEGHRQGEPANDARVRQAGEDG